MRSFGQAVENACFHLGILLNSLLQLLVFFSRCSILSNIRSSFLSILEEAGLACDWELLLPVVDDPELLGCCPGVGRSGSSESIRSLELAAMIL